MNRPARRLTRGLTHVFALLCALALAVAAPAADPSGPDSPLLVHTANGALAGAIDAAGVRSFKGIPYAQPPVGDLRWKAPQPPKNWDGVRQAVAFGPRAMQLPLFRDMVFRSQGMSEDCLYLNVWTPAASDSAKPSDKAKLPVMVYFFGGGFVAGDASESRYDGASLARRGIVTVNVTFRLGVFGFLAHPELSRESPRHASGDYGLLDQNAALLWVRRNIAAFGGDPARVTVAGESAGSFSVCAQMASPLSKDLIAGAIGESGGLMGSHAPVPLADAEADGVKFASGLGASSLAALRALPADQVLQATAPRDAPHFGPDVDGYFFPQTPAEIFAAGRQAHVPLLVGWNSEESGGQSLFRNQVATPENFAAVLQTLYGSHAALAQSLYPASTDAEAMQSATDLASDRFIAFSTWKWYDLHRQTGGKPVFRYFYAHPRPGGRGAVHSSEIEYALGNLAGNTVYAWTPDDEKVSTTLEGYFADFIKTGDPNGPGLPFWLAANRGGVETVLHIDVDTHTEREQHRARYEFLDRPDTPQPHD